MSLDDLGRRAVACKHWRWMEGMQVKPLCFRAVWLTEDMIGESDQTSYFWKNVPDIFPDLSDPATLGCLIALVEEAWKCPVDMSFAGAHRLDADAEERVYPQDHTVSFAAKTRVEALVAALEAAP
jgi:hypothetical protein